MPDLSDTVAKCRIGTAKNFTLLLLLYHTQAKGQDFQPITKEQMEQLSLPAEWMQ